MNNFQEIYDRAVAAGRTAAEALVPRPMAVQASNSLTGDFNWNKPYEVVEDGVCGFAWINVFGASKAGRKDTPFVAWLRQKAQGDHFSEYGRYEEYAKAWQIWVRGYGQSMQKKAAYAGAFAGVLKEAGIAAYAAERMD